MSGLLGGGSNGGGIAGGLPTGVKLAAVALLAHQLTKHTRAEEGATSAVPTGGGGLGGILGGLLGQGGSAPSSFGMGGGGLGGMLGGLLGGGAVGGLGGLLDGLRGQGLGRHVDSWVAPGENHPVAPHELQNAFDPNELDEAARHAGTDRGTLLNELSRMLPGAVDHMTPGGRIPQRGEDLGQNGIGGLLGHLLGGGR
ncbi:YidB family protein [Belnapia sp. F-4-1]|uniref:YidB family protein n=1 Tax=Belnapia sp. F-4-1 TaxID=1545443 RepID=UPI00068AEB22|nr:YidB family protein [Belnapia sp. F-4-1]